MMKKNIFILLILSLFITSCTKKHDPEANFDRPQSSTSSTHLDLNPTLLELTNESAPDDSEPDRVDPDTPENDGADIDEESSDPNSEEAPDISDEDVEGDSDYTDPDYADDEEDSETD